MKTIITTILAAIITLSATTASAQGLLSKKKEYQGRKERSEYMQGAIPQNAEGKIVFTTTISAPGHSASNILQNLQQWAGLRYMPSTSRGVWNEPNYYNNGEFARMTVENGNITCQADEEIVFTNRTLARDASKIYYTLDIQNIADGKATATVRSIAYVYNLTDVAERIEAENWITDAEAISKKGTLYKGSAKFRIKTIDFVEALFAQIQEAANK